MRRGIGRGLNPVSPEQEVRVQEIVLKLEDFQTLFEFRKYNI